MRVALTFIGDGGPVDVPVTPLQAELFHLLASRPDYVFRQDEIWLAIWKHVPARPSKALTTTVCVLRHRLRRAGFPGYVRTVRGVGYALR